MKKLFLFLCLAIGISTQAQLTYEGFEDGDSEYAFNNRSLVVKLGAGITPNETFNFDGYKSTAISPVLSIGLDNSWFDFGKGFILSRHATIGVRQMTIKKTELYPFEEDKKEYKNTQLVLNVGLGLHKSFSPKFEIYSNIAVSATAFNISNVGDTLYPDEFKDAVKFRPSLGARYKFTKKIGIFAEGALGIENFRAGISFF